MNDVGIVLYTKGKELGTLEAKWFSTPTAGGTGKAVGGPEHGFSGTYSIKYYKEDGSFDTELDLEIHKTNNAYKLLWKKGGTITATGTGMRTAEGLAAGWCNIS